MKMGYYDVHVVWENRITKERVTVTVRVRARTEGAAVNKAMHFVRASNSAIRGRVMSISASIDRIPF